MKTAFYFVPLLLTGCVASKISPQLDRALLPEAGRLLDRQEVHLQTDVERIRRGGEHCHEPMLYVLTFGLIPTHCTETYLFTAKVRSDEDVDVVIMRYEVTTVQGWLMAFYPLRKDWKFGSIRNAPERARNTVLNRMVDQQNKPEVGNGWNVTGEERSP